MSLIFVTGQKGGPGKSTISRAIGTCFAAAKWDVKIADLDVNQSTVFAWHQRRLSMGIKPVLSVEAFGSASLALKQKDHYDLYVVDGAPTSSRATKEVSSVADLIVIPTGLALDDLEPSVRLAHQLKKDGVEAERICFVFNRASGTEAEYRDAQEYLSRTPYFLVDGKIEDKPSYRSAMNAGKSILETPYVQPKKKADYVIQGIIERFEELTN